MHIRMINSMMMDRVRYSVGYLVRQIDSLQESIFVAMFSHRIVRQLMNVQLDHCLVNVKIQKISIKTKFS